MTRFLLKLCFILFLYPLNLAALQTLNEGSLLRDAEVEDIIKSYLIPIFKAAKLDPNSLHLYIVYSKAVNAMAMGGGRIALNTALLLKATSASQLIGVLAHETAHLADHHLVRGGDAYEKALLQQLLGTLGGIAAGIAGGRPEVASAIMMGSQDAALRGLLKYSRTQEGAADQGATRFLDSLQWSSHGMLEFMESLHKSEFLATQDLDPYLLTHPLLPERIDFFRSHVSKSLYAKAPLPESFEKNFKRMQTKVAAFTDSLAKTLSRFGPTDDSLHAHYARAIAYFQASHEKEALEELESLLKEYPDDAFFWELKGQILFESGRIKEAQHAYEKAVALRPDIPLLHLNLAHSLIEQGDITLLEKAHSELLRIKTEEPDNPFTYHLLAIYYGRTGKTGLAALSLAELAFGVGDLPQAEQQAKRALQLLKDKEDKYQRALYILEEIDKEKHKDNWMGI